MPKEYPGFIIDRSRRSAQSKHTHDYLVCTDREVGFIAKIYKLNGTQFEIHNARVNAMGEDGDTIFAVARIGQLAAVLEVVDHLHPPIIDKPKLKSLMKKALRAYLMGEASATIGDGSAIDKQIGVVAEMERLSISQYDSLLLNNGKAAADEIIAQLHAAVDSLEVLKKITMQFHGKQN